MNRLTQLNSNDTNTMPTTTTHTEAAARAAAELNAAAIADGLPFIPTELVCLGRGSAALEGRASHLHGGIPYAHTGQQWEEGWWNGNARDYFYAVPMDVFVEHFYDEPVSEPEPEPVLESEPQPRRFDIRVGAIFQLVNGEYREVTGIESADYPVRTNDYAQYTLDGYFIDKNMPSDRDFLREVTEPIDRGIVPIEEGKCYITRGGALTSPMRPSGVEFHCNIGCYDSDGTYSNGSRLPSNYDIVKEANLFENYEVFDQFARVDMIHQRIPAHAEGYIGWRYLGRFVTKLYNHPWVYLNSSGDFGGIKSNDQALDGARGHYFEMIPEPCKGDGIDERKRRASDKAYGKFWSAYAKATHDDDFKREALVDFINDHINSVARHRQDNGVICAAAVDVTSAVVLQYDRTTQLFTQCPMTWGKVHAAVIAGSDDDSRREFIRQIDATQNASRVTVEWSTVDDTYCTPMHGWSENRSVTGSCMEKFCDDGDAGHAVFEIYNILERNGHLQMIKIYICGDYVGRAICWRSGTDNSWLMDRVYCRVERGEIPPDVVTELAEFAAREGIVGRFNKCCVDALPFCHPSFITCSGLMDHEYYPYLDTYSGVSSRGLHCDGSEAITCDDADGHPNGEDEHEPYGRNDYYPESDLVWSSHHDAWLHEDDAVNVSGVGYVHHDDTVEDYNGNMILSRDSVALGPDEDDGYAASDDDDLVEVHLGNRHRTFYAIRA